MNAPQEQTTRQLKVTSCEEVTRGTRPDGSEWRLFKVKALTADGQPVNQELRSFQDLPVAELRSYDVERYEKENSVSYTLKLPREKLGPRVERLEGRVSDHDKRIGALEQGRHQPELAPAEAVSGAPGDDVPF